MSNTGEPARDVKEDGERNGETHTKLEALQAVKLGMVGVRENRAHGKGP